MMPVYTLWSRELVRFFRQKSRIAGALGTPLVFWLLIGSGIGRSFSPPGAPDGVSYLEYFFPGTLLLIVLFAAIFSTISIIEDRREGFLQGVLVAPVSRLQISLGKVLGGATVATLQASLFLLLAPAAGLKIDLGSGLQAVGVLFMGAAALTSFGLCLAWTMTSIQGFHAIMNLLLMPLWVLSGAFFPADGAPAWLAGVMRANPVAYALSAVRHALQAGGAAPSLGTIAPMGASLAVVGAFGLAMLWLSTALRSPART